MASEASSVVTAQGRRVEIIGHRGSSHLAPENTLAALKLGWKETTTCELDIQPTLDGKLLVIHDDSTRRTTGVDLRVGKHSLRELQSLDAGSFKGVRWKGEKLPSLEEVIAAMPANRRLFIEVKTGPAVMAELARVIRASGKEKQLLIHSFFYSTCVQVRKVFPHLPVYFLIASRKNPRTGAWSPSINQAVLKAQKAGLDGIGSNNTPLVNASALHKIHSAGLKLNIWTVNRVAEAKKLISLGVDGLITNRPGWLKAQFVKTK